MEPNKKIKAEDENTLMKKHFKGYLVLDWKTGGMRVIKSDPLKRKAKVKLKIQEISIRIDCVIRVPKMPEIVARGDFEIPATKVNAIFLDEL